MATEEEQIEALKRWWNDYGKMVVAAVVVALGGFWGWTQYQSHKLSKAEDSSVMFEKMVSAVGTSAAGGQSDSQNSAEALAVARQLVDDTPDSLYGNFADLYLAKSAVKNGDLDTARAHLELVVDRAAEEAIQELAELRLARVHAALGNAEAALEILDQDDVSAAFQPLFTEVKGDLYVAQDKLAEAQQAYQQAMDALEMSDFMRRQLLETKLNNTKVASSDSDATSADKSQAEPSTENPESEGEA